jgi:hypothetical protein
VPCKAMIHDIVTELHSKELVLGAEMSWKRHTDWIKSWWLRYLIRNKPKEVITSFGSSVYVGK